jgi:hypothetical protein
LVVIAFAFILVIAAVMVSLVIAGRRRGHTGYASNSDVPAYSSYDGGSSGFDGSGSGPDCADTSGDSSGCDSGGGDGGGGGGGGSD